MNAVHKYRLAICDEPTLHMPKGAQVLHIAADAPGWLLLWAEVDTGAAIAPHRFILRGTGHPLPAKGEFVGTVIAPPFVWHVWRAA